MTETDPYILDQVRHLTQQGESAKAIANRLGRSERQVVRYRGELGVAKRHPGPYPEAVRRRARRMLEDGASYSEVSKTLGVSTFSVAAWFPGAGWTESEGAAFRNQVAKIWRVAERKDLIPR